MENYFLGLRGWAFLFWLATIVLFSGCVPDDQTIIKQEHLSIGNPVPVSADGSIARFRANNEAHKILLAVFDTGVDYNHPQLRDHVHFVLDAEGKPVGAGRDYLALDDWAAPRIVETSAYEFEFLSDRQKKEAIDRHKTKESYNDSIRRERMGKICAVDQLIKLDARLEKFIQSYRGLSTEDSETKHGTHVAGLMTYDNPAIGIIPYRVLPYHQTEEDEAEFALGKTDRFVTNLKEALAHARRAGVKIVNLSLGGSFEKPTNSNDSAYEEKLEKYNNYRKMLSEGLTALVKEYSEILFIAAAGNDAGWSDNESRLQYPCGIDAPNMLCVGALNKDGTLARFTNLPLNKVDLVLASGVKLISTIPHDNCQYLRSQLGNVLTAGSNDAGLCKYDLKARQWLPETVFAEHYKGLISTLYSTCSVEKGMFEAMSGTSMATPIVSHLAAELWIETPSLKPPEVISALKARSTVDNSRQFIAYTLKAKVPSWYKLFREDNGPKDEDTDPDKNFSFFKNLMGQDLTIERYAQTPSAAAQKAKWFEFVVGGGV